VVVTYGTRQREEHTHVGFQRGNLNTRDHLKDGTLDEIALDGRLVSRLRGYHPVAPRPINCRPSVHRLCSSAIHHQRCSTPSDVRDPCW
jgi:hypothetical protein